ncbi:hypothetical protein ABTC37_19640, partial [Acinetobacter baumannii]
MPNDALMDEATQRAASFVPPMSTDLLRGAFRSADGNADQRHGEPDWARIPGFRDVTRGDWE